jgi:chorismate synthase
LTAPMVFAGALAKQILAKKGIVIGGHIERIGDVNDKKFDPIHVDKDELNVLRNKAFCVIDEEKGEKMKERILKAKEEKDSIGGVIECSVIHLPAGLGAPFFGSVEGRLSHVLFSIPAVKGVEFGTGFDISRMQGSEANDEFYIDDGTVKTYTNHNGGILGGITNGMPLIFRVAIKPTPSIGKSQRTIHIEKQENQIIEVEGRHDPCIIPRAIPVVEAATAMVILDLLFDHQNVKDW